jgi:hypothetical protein
MTNVVKITKEVNGHAVNGHATFDEFWDLFPSVRRSCRAICRMKWDAITSANGMKAKMKDRSTDEYMYTTLKATPEEILDGLKRSRERWQGKGEQKYGWEDGGRYIPMPATWLNQGRWMD